jgi:DNA topoisomerase-2
MNKESDSIEMTYVKLSPIEHVLKKPGMYVGDIDFRTEKQFINVNNHIVEKEISWSPALYKIVDELVVNSYDQSIRDKTLKNIKVDITSDSFSIYNDGVGIDIVMHKEHKIYIPELIFANLLTSTNYSDTEERITGGTHGLGAKLSAIFSKKFIIEVWDSKRNKYYKQIIENNLSKISKPEIKTEKKLETGGVKITMFPDFEKFKCKEFSPDMIQLLEKRTFDLIGLLKSSVQVFLNEKKLELSSFENYLSLYKAEEKWIIGTCKSNNNWTFAIRFNTNNMNHISFVNGIYTNRGGKHVDYIMDLLTDKLKKYVGPEFTKKLLYDYVTLCLRCNIVNPTFNSQTKEELNTIISKFGTLGADSTCIISDSFWQEVKASGLIEQLKTLVSLTNQNILSKIKGSKVSRIKNIPKLDDANFAGTKKSNECTLILTEGDSAKATAISGISAIPNGRNYYGVYPLRGKLLNVREASTSQIANNNEITELKKIMALKPGTTYSKDNINELRYGSIMIMTDADEDGSHIKGLIINFIDYFFPSLLEIPDFLKILVTPLVKATNNKSHETINFSNLRTYNMWKIKQENINIWKIKYYKGLGTSSSAEAGEYFQNISKNIITVTNRKQDNNAILLAFAKDKVLDRKIWLTNYKPNDILELQPPTTITINDFVHKELIHFSNYDNIRSIPSITDGLKPSQRKVLYACLKKNVYNETKVAQLASTVAAETAYHHGEQSLVSTIINMAQNFVGANNMNLLVPIGQFGTRLMGGKDHSSARYIYTSLSEKIDKIFKKDDMGLLENLEDDGYIVEPKYFLPIIPMILVNGCEGIGTGFSTFIPNYNIKDIITWYQNRLNGKKNNIIIPYYKDFKGTIIRYDDTTYVSSGKIEIDNNTVIITELPIKMWTNDYKEFLEELIYENKDGLFKSYTNMSSDTNVMFILKFNIEMKDNILKMHSTVDSDNLNQLYKYLRLYKTIKQSNMTLYNTNNMIQTYKSIEEILEEFYLWRIGFYEKRKELLLNKLKENIKIISNMIRFIELVKTNKKIFNLDQNDMIKYLKSNNLDTINDTYDYLTNMSFMQLSQNNLDKMKDKLKTYEDNYKELDKKTKKELWLDDITILLFD